MEKEGQFLHIPEFGARFGLSRIDVFRKVKEGAIPHRRKGKFYLIPLSFVNEIYGQSEDFNLLDRFINREAGDVEPVGEFQKRLSIMEIDHIAQKFNFDICYNGKVLTNCLDTPFLRGERRELFADVYEKASVLLYLLVKNKPFRDTNHELIKVSIIWFLYKNGKSAAFDARKFTNLCEWVQSGDSKFYKQIIESIEIFLTS